MGRSMELEAGGMHLGVAMENLIGDGNVSAKKGNNNSRKVATQKGKIKTSGDGQEKTTISAQNVPTGSFGTTTFTNEEMKPRLRFYHELHEFMASIGQPIQRLPTLGFKELDLWILYKEVTKRRGVDAVIAKKQWKEVADALNLPASCTDSGFRLRLHYTKYLEQYERTHFKAPPEIPSMDQEDLNSRRSPAVSGRKRKTSSKSQTNSWAESNQQSSDSMETAIMSPITSCDSPQPSSPKKRRADVADVSLDLSRLDAASLQRYRKRYDLQVNKKFSRQELASAVTDHFATNFVPEQDEKQIVLDFLEALHNRRKLTTY